MKTRRFLQGLDNERLIAAVRDAERGNSGDVVLFITYKKVTDAVARAHEIFVELKLEETTPQNSVLIFLAPESRTLAVIGGTDLYRVLPSDWWTSLVATITARLAAGHLTEGLLDGLRLIGESLRKNFPVARTVDRSNQQDLLEER